MAKHDRGAYEPSDEVRVFDGAEDDDDVEGSRLPLLIVLALVVLAMFGGVVWLAYTQGVARGRGETPVLTAAAGPERVAPAQQGGSNVPYQGFKIYEQPAPPDDSADGAPAQDAAKPAPPKPAAAAPAPEPAPQKPQAVTPATAPVVQAQAPKPVAAKPVPKPAVPAKPVPAPQKQPGSLAALIQQSDSTTPKASPAKSAPVAAAQAAASGAPRQLGQQTTSAAPASAGGSYVLQIGAYKSQADANAAWAAYKAKHAALLAGYSPDVKQADLGAKGTWYRLRVAGFGDREVASALCERLKGDGGACILAK